MGCEEGLVVKERPIGTWNEPHECVDVISCESSLHSPCAHLPPRSLSAQERKEDSRDSWTVDILLMTISTNELRVITDQCYCTTTTLPTCSCTQ